MRTVRLVLPYPLRHEGEIPPDEQDRKVRFRITEQFILGAAAALYPQGLNRQQAKIFQPIAEALTAEAEDVKIDAVTFDFLYDLFLSKEAEEKVRFAAAAAGWYSLWLECLEATRRE